MKIFEFFNKNKIHQPTQQEWILQMSSIVPLNQAMILSGDEIYNRVRLAKVSCNCETAAEGYFEIIAPICPIREDVAHSLLRIAMRMVFYLGVCKLDAMLTEIEYLTRNHPLFLKWLHNNMNMVALIMIELETCCIFYDLRFDIEKNAVILDHKRREEMKDVFSEVQDRDIFKEFLSFEDFKTYFYSLFAEYQISQDELNRLILEEDYKDNYFDLLLIRSEHWDVIDLYSNPKSYEELNAQLGKKHPLYRKFNKPIARCYSQDDVLYQLNDGTYAIIHLTYSRSNQDGWPRFIAFKNLENAVKHIRAMEY